MSKNSPLIFWGWVRAVLRRQRQAATATASITGAALAPGETLTVDQRPDLLSETLAEFERQFAHK